MRLRVEQLAKHLQGDLLPVYLIAGDEPLQQDEAMDAVRAAAREQGFDERQRFSADTGIDWNALINEAQSMSLFGGRRILELVLGEKRPDKTGSQIIRDLLAQPSPDTLLLIRCSRLDRRKDWNSAWVKALEKVGAVLEIWPVEGKQLQHWLRDRLAGRGLSIHDDALELLIERSEGNLLAAAQEVDKLAERFIDMIVEHLVDEKYGPNSLPEGDDVARLAEFITRIRPLAEAVVNDELGRVLEKSINKVLVDRLENVLDHLEKKQL